MESCYKNVAPCTWDAEGGICIFLLIEPVFAVQAAVLQGLGDMF